MAQRRMFSKTIVSSARFLKMPTDSQNLYFHLALNSDDDGVVEAFPIMRAVGSNEDNLRVLVAKGFIKILNDDLVSLILDWKEHNSIRADRKVDSIYKDLLLKVVPELQLLEVKPRADTGKPTGRPMDVQWTPDGPHRLGKDSIGKERLGEDSLFRKPSAVEVQEYLDKNGETRFTGQEFIDSNTAKGWVVGKNNAPMQCWESAVNIWRRNRDERDKQKSNDHDWTEKYARPIKAANN